MNSIYKGNAGTDGKLTHQWIVGSFIPNDELRKSNDVEIKWGVHPKDDFRKEWVTAEHRTSVSILVSGKFVIEFPHEQVELTRQGDYVMWGVGIDHRWRALEDSVIVTVRWPSASK